LIITIPLLDFDEIIELHLTMDVKPSLGQSIIVMNYVKGQSLKERIALGPMKLEEALDISTQVGEGLSMTFS
jgi:serine/threonine protein kinase